MSLMPSFGKTAAHLANCSRTCAKGSLIPFFPFLQILHCRCTFLCDRIPARFDVVQFFVSRDERNYLCVSRLRQSSVKRDGVVADAIGHEGRACRQCYSLRDIAVFPSWYCR
jgi:hypothetical protein